MNKFKKIYIKLWDKKKNNTLRIHIWYLLIRPVDLYEKKKTNTLRIQIWYLFKNLVRHCASLCKKIKLTL